jgi:capsular polysaccharide biosynthesis protein
MGNNNNNKTIRIGFLFRKDYLAHPRQGSQPRVSRKIKNEEQLITEIQVFLHQQEPKAILTPLYLESLSLKQQLEHVAYLDILVGMHGAGLSHVLFMKPGSVLVELAPMSHAALNFFEIMAKVNGVSYMKQSDGIDNSGGGDGEYYNIDTNHIVSTLKQALEQIKR